MTIEHSTDPSRLRHIFILRTIGGRNWHNLSFDVYPEPTQNCQLFSIAMAHVLLCLSQEELKQTLQQIYLKATQKRMLLVDLHQYQTYNFKKVFTPFIKGKPKVSNYTSSNGSKMAIVIFQLDHSKINN